VLNLIFTLTFFNDQAFQEFVATFQESANNKTGKVWVKAGTYDAGKRRK